MKLYRCLKYFEYIILATRMKALFGHIEPYTAERDFRDYVDRMEQFFIVNSVQNEKKVAMFLTLMGPEPYNVAKNLVAPKKPSEKSYEELIACLTSHYVTKKSTVAERYEFYKYKQVERQSVKDFVVEIKKKATGCDFGDFLNQALRDKLVCGVTSEALIKKFLTEGKVLTFEKAYEIAIAFESAERESKYMQPESSNVCVVNEKSKKVPFTTQYYECSRCGGHHTADKCFKKTWTCYICKKTGHIAAKCRHRTNRNAVKFVEESDRPDESSNNDGAEEIIIGSIMSIYNDGEGPAEVSL